MGKTRGDDTTPDSNKSEGLGNCTSTQWAVLVDEQDQKTGVAMVNRQTRCVFEKDTTIGLTLYEEMGKTGKQVSINKIMPNSQAAKLETLNVGDIIEKIGPTYVTGMDLETIVNLFKNRASHCVCIFRTPHQ